VIKLLLLSYDTLKMQSSKIKVNSFVINENAVNIIPF